MSLKIFLVVAFVGIAAATRTEIGDVGETQGLVRTPRQVEAGSLYGNAIGAPGVAPQYTIVQLPANSGSGRQQGSGVFGLPARLGGLRGLSSRGGFGGTSIGDGGGQPQLTVVGNPVASGNDEGNPGGYYVPSYSPIQLAGPAQTRFSSRQSAGPAAPMMAPVQLAGSAPGTYMTGQPAGQVVPDFRAIQAAGPAPSNYWSGQSVGPAISNLAPVQAAPSGPANYFTGQSALQPIPNFQSARGTARPAFANYFNGQPTGQGARNGIPFEPASANEAALNYIPNRLAGPPPVDYYAGQPARQDASGFPSSQSSGQFARFANPVPAPAPALSQPLWSNSANIGRSGPNQAYGFGAYPANAGYPGYPGYPIDSGSPGYPINSKSSAGNPINSASPGDPINSGSSGYPEESGSSGWKAKPCMAKILSHCPTCGSSKFQGH